MKNLEIKESMNLLFEFLIKKLELPYNNFSFEIKEDEIEIEFVNLNNEIIKQNLSTILKSVEYKKVILSEIFKYDTFYGTKRNKRTGESNYLTDIEIVFKKENFSNIKYFLSWLIHKMKLQKNS